MLKIPENVRDNKFVGWKKKGDKQWRYKFITIKQILMNIFFFARGENQEQSKWYKILCMMFVCEEHLKQNELFALKSFKKIT